jgi:hypothetical protein
VPALERNFRYVKSAIRLTPNCVCESDYIGIDYLHVNWLSIPFCMAVRFYCASFYLFENRRGFNVVLCSRNISALMTELISRGFLRCESVYGVWTTGRSGFDPRQGQRIFPLASVFRPALGPTQPPVQWVPGVLSPGVKCGRGVTLTTHPHLMPRSSMSRSYTCSPPKRLNGV